MIFCIQKFLIYPVMVFFIILYSHACMSVQYTSNMLQYLLGDYLTHRWGGLVLTFPGIISTVIPRAC